MLSPCMSVCVAPVRGVLSHGDHGNCNLLKFFSISVVVAVVVVVVVYFREYAEGGDIDVLLDCKKT